MLACVYFIKHNHVIGTAKIIQNESFKDNIFSNHDVNGGTFVSSCSSSGFSPVQLT